MLRDPQAHSGNVSACTLCLSCQNTCPVKVNLGDQVYQWRQQLDEFGTANKQKKFICKGMDDIFTRPKVYNMATNSAHLANHIPSFIMECGLNPWAKGHKMMKFPKKPFHKLFKDLEKDEDGK